MANREFLEALPTTALAARCGKLGEISPDSPIAPLLQTPPSSSLKLEQENDAKRADVRKRMIEFLEANGWENPAISIPAPGGVLTRAVGDSTQVGHSTRHCPWIRTQPTIDSKWIS
jgi:hypothetical protein